MQIELKNLKYAAFASEETLCFNATVYIDGVKAGTADSDGKGGATRIEPRALEEQLNAHAKTLPLGTFSEAAGGGTFEQDAESLLNDLVNAALALKDYKKLITTRLVWTRTDKPGIFQSKKHSIAQIQHWLTIGKLEAQIPCCKQLLNGLPEAEGFALFMASMR